MQENETPIQTTPPSEKKNANKDYLAPALVFIGLFFSFFVLITMQRLTRKVIDGEDPSIYSRPQPAIELTEETTAPPELTEEEQLERDLQMDTNAMGEEIINDIYQTTEGAEDVYNGTDLEDLTETEATE